MPPSASAAAVRRKALGSLIVAGVVVGGASALGAAATAALCGGGSGAVGALAAASCGSSECI